MLSLVITKLVAEVVVRGTDECWLSGPQTAEVKALGISGAGAKLLPTVKIRLTSFDLDAATHTFGIFAVQVNPNVANVCAPCGS